MGTNNKIRFAISCRAILWDYCLSGLTVDWVSNFSLPNMNCCDACAVVYGKRLVKGKQLLLLTHKQKADNIQR